MFRDRTNLYLSYRRTIPRSQTARHIDLNEEETLIGNRRFPQGLARQLLDQPIEMKPVIPSKFDIAEELDNKLVYVKQQVNEVNGLYKKLIIVNQLEKPRLEEQIEELNYRILKDFEQCYVLIKKFEYLENNHERLGLHYTPNDLEIIANFKKNYARQMQELLMKFRNLQNNYIKFLNNDDDETDLLLQEEEEELKLKAGGDDIEEYLKQILQSKQDNTLVQRDREISKLAMGILEISTIFKEMEGLVVDQGTMLDRIDYNLQNTVMELKGSDKELIKAKQYQKRTTKCKLIFLLLLIVFVLFMIVLVKPHGKTVKEPEQTKPDVKPEPDFDEMPDEKPERPEKPETPEMLRWR